jgi:mannose-6-phosphate isomerase
MFLFYYHLLLINASVERDFSDLDTFVIYSCLEGEYTLSWEDQSVAVFKGETILVPALISNFVLSVINSRPATLLEVYIS